MNRRRFALALLALAGCSDDPVPAPATRAPLDIDAFLGAPTSCAYQCPVTDCAEISRPYACPGLGPWAEIPHAETCPAWDGKYPASVEGQCAATAPSGEALKRPGIDEDSPDTVILPDGRATRPAGEQWLFEEAEIRGGITTSVVAVPGTPFVLTVDTGPFDHAVRAIDTTKIGTTSPVTGYVRFAPPERLNGSVAYVPPDRVYVATDFGVVQALRFDAASGALTRDDPSSLVLPISTGPGGGPDNWYTASVAASPDGARLAVSAVEEERLLLYDIDPASPAYRQQLGAAELGEDQTFGAYFDPNDPTGSRVYVSLWAARTVVEVDVSDAAAPVVARAFETDQNPQGITFLDARWMAVANDLGETISLVDRAGGSVTSVPVDFEPGLKGLDVSGVAYDGGAGRLYATLGGINALAVYDVDLGPEPPSLTPIGRLPTAWWPSGVVVHPGGTLTVTTLRGKGIGPLANYFPIGGTEGPDRMRGSVHRVEAPGPAELAAGDAQVRAAVAVGTRPGYPTVDCPPGIMDFPVPQTNTEGPSPRIKHVFFIIRENKTFDALLGDIAGVKGDPNFTLKPEEDMERVWPNFRDLARTFALSDSFHNLAVRSQQGHVWTTYGRSIDYVERTWSDASRQRELGGIGAVGKTEDGSLFDWLQRGGVRYDILGEAIGAPATLPADHNPIDLRYPGGLEQNILHSDLEKACYTAARVRVACDIGSFVYMTMPNDHTLGVTPEYPTPEVMCAVNDEATGLLVDAISHSPIWESSLIVITEDDPQQGGDHVDFHRTPLVLVSPWVKRGYVSSALTDVASLHKLFAHIFGQPYPHLLAKNAGLPLDMFTSTPDYTPYTYQPRVWPLGCGDAATDAEKKITASWDFAEVDEQPGLGDQVVRWMRGKQLTELTPELEAEIADRHDRRARGLPPLGDEDDD